MEVVGSCDNDRIGLYLVEHLDIVRKKLYAGGRRGLCLLDQVRVWIGDRHQFGGRLIRDDLEQSPHVVVIETYNSKTRPGLARHICWAGESRHEKRQY